MNCQSRKESENHRTEGWWFCASQVQASGFIYLFNYLYLFTYLLSTIFTIERWQKQYMRNFKTIMYWANWWLFYTDRPHACPRRDSTWAGHLKPPKVKKCWRRPSATAPDSPCRPGDAAPCAPSPWASCMLKGSEGYCLTATGLYIWWLSQPSQVLPQDSGGGGFPWALPLRANIQMFMEPLPQLITFFVYPVEYWSRAVVLALSATSSVSLGSLWLS